MIQSFRFSRRTFGLSGAGALSLVALAIFAAPAGAQVGPSAVSLTQISSDPYTIPPGQHATQVEPHALAYGSTIVSAFQTGRIAPGGSTDVGWATSTDGGVTWTHGFLPGITTGEGSGPYSAVSDPAVAYDPKHGIWMINTLPIANFQVPAVLVSRSTDGINWEDPVSVDPTASSSDKNWIVCDSNPTSKYYGNCYIEWDNPDTGDGIQMSTSTDGGLTWSNPNSPPGSPFGIGGQPLVQPNGTVIVPIESNAMSSFSSTNGGATWSSLVTISGIDTHLDAGGIRSGPLPSAAMDGAGTVYVMWEDCRFRTGCSTNDLVYSTSTNGTSWSAVTRVPIDPTTSTVDHFIPGIGIDPATSGASAHLAVHFYYYPVSNCTTSSCKLFVGYISSANGGSTWGTPKKLAGPMHLKWLPNSQNGLMVGDYIATAFNSGIPHGVFAVATANVGKKYDEAMFTAQGLTVTASGPQLSSAGDHALPNVHGDPIEKEQRERAVPPSKRSARSAKK